MNQLNHAMLLLIFSFPLKNLTQHQSRILKKLKSTEVINPLFVKKSALGKEH